MIRDKRQQIEDLRKQVEERLEELRMSYYKKYYNNEIDRIIGKLSGNKEHIAKRIVSFDILDNLLDCCQLGFCPPLDSMDQMFLVDYSMRDYIEEKAKEYFVQGDVSDKRVCREVAEQRVKCIFDCQVKPNLSAEFFEHDLQAHKSGETLEGACGGRVSWCFLECIDNSRAGHPVQGFNNSAGYVDELFCGCDADNMVFDICRMKWEQTLDVANGMDMYRFCRVRGMMLNSVKQEKA